MDRYCVYKHTCPNGKVYIGITKQNPLARWKNGLGYKHNEHFFNAILKYGWDNIKHEILATELTDSEAAEREVALIREYKSTDRRYGYNIHSGGFVPRFSQETKEKISKAMIEQFQTGQRSRVRSEETKLHTSMTLKRKFANGEIVRTISEEQKQKISMAHTGRKLSEEHKEKIKQKSHRKPVVQYDNDVVVCVYSGVREAGRVLGIDYTCIVKVLKGYKHTAGGYSWKYAIEE